MLVLMKCVAEAVVAKGLRGLFEIVPGGAFLYDVANESLRRLKDRKRAEQLREEVLQAATASFDEAKAAAEKIAKEVAAGASPEEQIALEMYLTQIPGAVRQSLKRTDDPSGKSVPANFALSEPADLLKRLPSKVPHFRPNDPLPGKPGWQLVELLGTGGFGEVWLARNPALSALKGAVKFGLDPQARDRLLRHEGTLVNRVMEQGKHPNVVQLLDAHLEGDAPWLMYEYVPGGDLTGLILAWQSLPINERVNRTIAALRTLAGAVGHFHRLSPPIVHRDLKPANILVSSKFQVPGSTEKSSHLEPGTWNSELKVADFGIGGVAAAASLAHEASRRSTGALMSQLWGSYTPLYASPQQQAGNPPDPRDDVHALGVIGYQMLTGKLDATLGADYAKTLRRLNVPEPLIELLGDCAAHDPDNRPNDAVELVEKLARIASPGSSSTSTPGMELVPCPNCGAKLKVATGETRPVKCGKCAHTFRPYALAAPPPPPPPPLPPMSYYGTGDKMVAVVHLDQAEKSTERPRPVAKPVDRHEPEPEPEPQPERERRARREPKRSGGRVFTFGCLFVLLLAIGAVGGVSYLAYRAISGGLFPKKPDVVIEGKLTFPEKVRGRLADMTFMPGSRQLLTISEDGTVQLWDTEGGTGVKTVAAQFPDHRPAISPDGTRLATVGENNKVVQLDMTTGEPTGEPLVGMDDKIGPLAFTGGGNWVLAGGAGGKVKAWELSRPLAAPWDLKGQLEDTETHKGGVNLIVADQRGRYVATAGNDGLVKVWDVNDTSGVANTIGPGPSNHWAFRTKLTGSGKANAIGFTPDGKRLIVGWADGSLKGWDAEKKSDIAANNQKLGGPVKRLVFSPNSERVAAIGVGGTAKVWDASLTGVQVDIPGQVNTVAFFKSEDRFRGSDLMATGGDNGTVLLWEMFFKNVRGKLFGHTGPVVAVAFSPDGKRLASADAHGTVIIWLLGEVKSGLGDPVEIR